MAVDQLSLRYAKKIAVTCELTRSLLMLLQVKDANGISILVDDILMYVQDAL